MRVSRADRSRSAEWWFTVDHVLVGAILAIVGAGLILSLAASPAVAIKKGLSTYYFVERHLVFSAAGVLVMLAVSLLSPRGVRRLSLMLLLLGVGGMFAVHFVGEEINGARRWLSFAGHSIQPSEFVKPAFVVVAAWLFAESETRHDMPALPLAILLAVLLAALLLAEPDVGQTLLLCMVWGALYYLSGQPLLGAGIAGACGVLGLVFAYSSFDHVRARIDRFLAPTPGDFSQLDRAIKSFSEGGFLGRGPGEGTIKTVLPDAHTDFIFAVVAEEYGVIACLVLVSLFAFVVMRALVKAAQEPDAATRLAIQGLALLFGLQALINMGVNVGLLPAKGITLPFISAGGSSTLAVSITLGMLLALTRRRPHPAHLRKPPIMPHVGPRADGIGAQVREEAKSVLLAAGGTGGHLFPAQALAEELQRRAIPVDLVTDMRGDRYGTGFPARQIYRVPAATLAGRSPVAMMRTAFLLARGLAAAYRLLGKVKPSAVVGFGGYPTFPPLKAASLRGIPTALHEQNAVLGRANRMLAKGVTCIATSFETTKSLGPELQAKASLTGNPVRTAVIEAAQRPYAAPQPGGPIELVVFGGSQGARFFSEAVPPALGLLPADMRQRLNVVQQARAEDLDGVVAAYRAAGIRAEVAPFFRDLPQRLAAAHLVVSRSGASTVAELTVIGRPSILVPLPHALDNDQLQNALRLAESGAAWCIEQKELSPRRLAGDIGALLGDPGRLGSAAAVAKRLGRPDAVGRLADLVVALMSERRPAP